MRKLLNFFFVVVFSSAAAGLYAQGTPPPSQSGSGTNAPIDGAAGILLVAAAAYGYKKLKADKTTEEEKPNV